MARLLVRGLPAKSLRRLKERAARNRRSLESEARIVSEEWHKRFAGREFGYGAEIIRPEREGRIKRIVVHLLVDASVVVNWLIPENHPAAAQALLDSRNTLHAPDLIDVEIASALVNRHLAGDLTRVEVDQGIDDLDRFPIFITPGTAVRRAAVELAIAMRPGVYDCYYLALATMRGIRMVTADKKFLRSSRTKSI